MNYQEFLKSKKFKYQSNGINISKNDINPILFDYQKDITKWAAKKGRCAIGIELKASYFRTAIQNLSSIDIAPEMDLFCQPEVLR